MRVPNWMARLTRDAARGSPSCLKPSLNTILSPVPGDKRRSASMGRGRSSRAAMTGSARKGWRASRPRSATMRSSRPRLRCHSRAVSAAISSATAPHPWLRKVVRWRPYPPHCSSAPCPSITTRALLRYGRPAQPGGRCCCEAAEADDGALKTPSPDAAAQRAVPMLRSMTVVAGYSSCSRRARWGAMPSSVAFTSIRRHSLDGAQRASSSRASRAASRSGLVPAAKQHVARSMGSPAGSA
mmetsp:Transcript_9310/g.27990  ORF Transcript_9310/g.27990 Transcript_9310/m.27990 type:complete len:241 (-) Transcript_9310:56-778(-)